jgi:hypothetical protein
MRVISKTLLFIFWILLAGCDHSTHTISMTITSASTHSGIFVAYIGGHAEQTYEITINSTNSLDIDTNTYTIVLSPLYAPFSITNNTCQNIRFGTPCELSIQYAPTSSGDYFNQQTLSLNVAGISQNIILNGVAPTTDLPITEFAAANKKTGISVAAGGPTLMAMFDTGSAAFVIEEDYVGPNITMTNKIITIHYSSVSVQGKLGYGSVKLNDNSFLTTNSNTPIIVVPKNSIFPTFSAHAVLGAEMDNQISALLYLPYPYNQMIIVDRPDNKITLGTLTLSEINNIFGTVSLAPAASCNNYYVPVTINVSCWNDRNIPVVYAIDEPSTPPTYETFGTLFDTGADDTSMLANPLPSWANVVDGFLENIISAVTLQTSTSNFNLFISNQVKVRTDVESGPIRFNSGPTVFNAYEVLFDRVDGIFGLKPSS